MATAAAFHVAFLSGVARLAEALYELSSRNVLMFIAGVLRTWCFCHPIVGMFLAWMLLEALVSMGLSTIQKKSRPTPKQWQTVVHRTLFVAWAGSPGYHCSSVSSLRKSAPAQIGRQTVTVRLQLRIRAYARHGL